MFKFIIDLWSGLGLLWSDFINFIIDNRLTSLLIVAILGLAISGFVNSLKTNIVEYYLNKLFKTSNNNLIMFLTAFIQFLIIIIILYFIYRFILKKIAERFMVKESYDDITWKKNMLLELQKLNSDKCNK